LVNQMVDRLNSLESKVEETPVGYLGLNAVTK